MSRRRGRLEEDLTAQICHLKGGISIDGGKDGVDGWLHGEGHRNGVRVLL